MFYSNDFTILLDYVVGWKIRSSLTGFLQYFAKNMAFSIQKCLGFFGQNPFSAILRLKTAVKCNEQILYTALVTCVTDKDFKASPTRKI